MSQDNLCPICQRPLGDRLVEAHHLIPRTFKGRQTVDLHKICHQKIHATFAERELFNYYHTIERLREHTEMAAFIKWVQKKAPDYYSKNDDTAARHKRR